MSDFHASMFDDATKLKLEIFRGYIREWLPVFLSKKNFREIHIYDFFCGPGTDGQGNPGSPLVIVEELESYIEQDGSSQSSSRPVYLHFNDNDPEKIRALQNRVRFVVDRPNCRILFTATEFEDAFHEALPSIRNASTANLLILDQYGIKAVNERVFQMIVDCSGTDMLFFISSSYIRRFVEEEAIKKYFKLTKEEISAVSSREIHRFVCNRVYRGMIPNGTRYHLAPFSIEKGVGSNIYGIIFGTSDLLGLRKFLEVCWDKDAVTGEANFNIDDDITRYGQQALFPEDRTIKKQDRFEQDLEGFIRKESPDNRRLFEFVLERGFLAKHANGMLRQLQKEHRMEVYELESGAPARRGAFYLTYDDYKQPARFRFRMIGD